MTNREPFFTGVPGYQNHFFREGKIVVNNGEHLEDTEPLAPDEISPELAVAVDSMTRVLPKRDYIDLGGSSETEHDL